MHATCFEMIMKGLAFLAFFVVWDEVMIAMIPYFAVD
jgi:hypothetical protein